MKTADAAGFIIGHTRRGAPVYAIAGAEEASSGGDGGEGGTPDPKDAPKGGGAGDPGADEFKPIQDQAALDRIVQSRLARERAKTADYEDLKKKAAEFDKLQDSQKTELQKAAEERDAANSRATAAEQRALRLEVAAEKGLSTAQAKRLVGETREDLEADADELLESFKPSGEQKPPTPGGKPRERLRGGGDPNDEPEETDPRKLAEKVPRL